MARILITGAGGLIGRHLVSRLEGVHELWALSRVVSGEADSSVYRIGHDLTADRLPSDLPERIDAVIHLAQSPHFREFPEQARHVYDVNVGSTMRLLEYARRAGASRFLYASSGGIYGTGDQHFAEDDPVIHQRPLGFYLASKHCGELLVENYAQCFPVAILRFFFVYGSGQRSDMLIPRLIQSVASGRPIFLQGEDGIRINPVHVSDAVAAIEAALGLEGSHKVNVGGPEVLTLRQIGETIGSILERTPVFQQQPGLANHLVGDIDRMSRVLHRPAVWFRDGVSTICAEYGAGGGARHG